MMMAIVMMMMAMYRVPEVLWDMLWVGSVLLFLRTTTPWSRLLCWQASRIPSDSVDARTNRHQTCVQITRLQRKTNALQRRKQTTCERHASKITPHIKHRWTGELERWETDRDPWRRLGDKPEGHRRPGSRHRHEDRKYSFWKRKRSERSHVAQKVFTYTTLIHISSLVIQ